jgi:hypothetical protein
MKSIVFFILSFMSGAVFAQDLSYSKPNQMHYEEMPNPKSTDVKEWAKLVKNVNVSFADDNVRYPKEVVPQLTIKKQWNATAWKGEKVHTQILVWTKKNIDNVSFQLKNLKNI